MSQGTKTRKQSANGSRPALLAEPLMSPQQAEAEQDRLIANMLAGIATEEMRLHILQKANRHDDAELVPGDQMGRTYAEAVDLCAINKAQVLEVFGEEQYKRARSLLSQPQQ